MSVCILALVNWHEIRMRPIISPAVFCLAVTY